jgi:hypothetical protein
MMVSETAMTQFGTSLYRHHVGSSITMEQRTLINVNHYLNTNINSHLKISSGQSSNLALNIVHFNNTNVN